MVANAAEADRLVPPVLAAAAAMAGAHGGLPRREHGIELDIVRRPEAKRGFVLLPRRRVVERSFAWVTRFRRLAKDYERLPSTVAGLNLIAFACTMLRSVAQLATGS